MAVQVAKQIEFDAGHRVPSHKSKCQNPHGHRYTVVVHCVGDIVAEPGASDEGMLIDFGDLKILMTTYVHDVFDHGFIVYEGDQDMLGVFGRWRGQSTGAVGVQYTDNPAADWRIIIFPYIPTAENIARWVYEVLQEPIDNSFRGNLELAYVEVYETPTSTAMYPAT